MNYNRDYMKQTFIDIAITGFALSVIVACAMAGISIWLEHEWETMLLVGTSGVSTAVALCSMSFPCNKLWGWILGSVSCFFFSAFTYILYILVMFLFGFQYDDGMVFHIDALMTILKACGVGSIVFLVC